MARQEVDYYDGDKYNLFLDLHSSTAISTPANSSVTVPSSSFNISKGTYIFDLYFNCNFSSTNNMWVYLTDGTNSYFSYRMSFITSGTQFFFVGCVLADIPADTSLHIEVVSYLTQNQTFTPANITVKGAKL